ncbi:hypothetical protein [Flavobacterium commune]|uniref:DNA adenine methylase n=1 Tax=Flavobacterium commune TaxID=1306519 RepID=A0A1D9PCC1_9FLAO|nr:hypothetical protein [Flavobacterium commune]APA00214.1 hypothetical protein BIW12_12685 [Flavobacterium commune]
MNKIDITNFAFSNDRAILRKQIITLFLDETPGTGKEHLTSRYYYITKTLNDGREVYLSRPAQFNNGFDFTLNVSGINFNLDYYNEKGNLKRSTTRPSHVHILDDLRSKKNENLELYNSLLLQIDLIYNCQNPTQINFAFTSGYSTELILECIKWLFVEQDVTYWNYSGRAMFYGGIKGI